MARGSARFHLPQMQRLENAFDSLSAEPGTFRRTGNHAVTASGDDLSAATLRELLPGRALRAYPALLSTDADARAWGRGRGRSM